MMNVKTYSDYKQTGVFWVTQVPSHWDVLPNRAIFYEVNDKGHSEEQMLSVTISKGVVSQKQLLKGSSKKDSSNEDKSKYKLVKPQEIVYNKMRAWQGALGVSDFQGIVSPAYIIVKPRSKQNSRYFHYLYRTPLFNKEAQRWSHGITSDQWSLRYEDFKCIHTPLPSLIEQDQIVRYLDFQNHQIDTFIRIKKRQIELLNEQKRTIINKAVTCGVDPQVKLKHSGVDWLGEIPEHWEVRPIKRAFRSMDYGISDPSTDDGIIPVLTMGDIKDGNVSIPPSGGVNSVPSDLLLKDKDLLFNRTNSADLVAKVGLLNNKDNKPITFASYLVRLRVTDEMDAAYLNYLLNSPKITKRARQLAIPSLHQSNLNPTRYGQIPAPFPKYEEQLNIAQYLNQVCGQLDNGIRSFKNVIDSTNTYRTRLITDTVTGAVDVRNIKVPEVEEIAAVEVVAGTLKDEDVEEETIE